MLTGKEKDLLLDIFEFYTVKKFQEDKKNLSVFFDLAREIGEVGDVGELYEKSKPLHDLKHRIENQLSDKRKAMIELRNKLLTL